MPGRRFEGEESAEAQEKAGEQDVRTLASARVTYITFVTSHFQIAAREENRAVSRDCYRCDLDYSTRFSTPSRDKTGRGKLTQLRRRPADPRDDQRDFDQHRPAEGPHDDQ